MRRLLLLLTCACLGAQVLAAVPGPADRRPTDPDDDLLAGQPGRPARPGGRPLLHAIGLGALVVPGRPVDRLHHEPDGPHEHLEGALRRRVAGADGPVRRSPGRAVWSHDGRHIVYAQDVGGNEVWDLYAVPSDGGATVNVTKTPEVSETNAQFSPDGRLVAFERKPERAPVVNLAVMNWSDRSMRELTHEETKDHLWALAGWSPDGKSLYATRGNIGSTDADVYRVDVASGHAENLTPHQGEVLYAVASVSPDGKTLLVSSNEKGGFENVALLDGASRKLTWVTDTQWQAMPGSFSADNEHFTYMINHDGMADTYVATRANLAGERVDMPQGLTVPDGTPSAFSPDGARLIISHQSAQRPSDFWIYRVADKKAEQLTRSAVASLQPSAIPPAQVVHYASFDGKIISALLWMPYNLQRDGSAPAVLLPHGGPTGQTVDYFNRTAAALASRGYVCLAPNVRGSTGYGIEFQKANYKDLGGGDLQDEVYGVTWLIETGYVDKQKVGITGGSYGGFMTLMAIGKTPDVWAAAVEEFGIINWLTMLEHSNPLLQQYQMSLLGNPQTDRAVYEAASPLKYIRDAKAPLLVLQGENDIRVPKEEAEQVVQVLKQAGKTVEAHYYAQEGHGFAKRENQIDAMRRTIDWFDKYLKQGQGARGKGQGGSSKGQVARGK